MRQQDTTKELDLKPDEEELAAIAEKTRAALEGIVDKKVKANKNRALSKDAGGAGPVFVKYTPSETKDTSSAAADSRIIRISEVPIDPFEPSRFKHRKVCFVVVAIIWISYFLITIDIDSKSRRQSSSSCSSFSSA